MPTPLQQEHLSAGTARFIPGRHNTKQPQRVAMGLDVGCQMSVSGLMPIPLGRFPSKIV
ncbi:MAG: hypothetical protein KME19_03850 [Microcoleus vaginatus WJT46-NPBG5]|nr:hypothetical protein [Microcoleus vaginatus WJT46-NPBG5]